MSEPPARVARIDGIGPDDLLTLVIGSFAEWNRSTRIRPELRIVLRSEIFRMDIRKVADRLESRISWPPRHGQACGGPGGEAAELA